MKAHSTVIENDSPVMANQSAPLEAHSTTVQDDSPVTENQSAALEAQSTVMERATEYIFTQRPYCTFEFPRKELPHTPAVVEDKPAVMKDPSAVETHQNVALEAPSTIEVATKFTCFQKLPAELRVKIWKVNSVNCPRLVEIQFRDGQWWSNTAVPSILHVNREARHEGLKVYKLSFTTQIAEDDETREWKFPAVVYYSPLIDTIFLDSATVERSNRWAWPADNLADWRQRLARPRFKMFPIDIKAVKSIAFEASMFSKQVDDYTSIGVYNSLGVQAFFGVWMGAFKETFPNLESLDLVYEVDSQGKMIYSQVKGDKELKRAPARWTEAEKMEVIEQVKIGWLRFTTEDTPPVPSMRSIMLYRDPPNA